LINSRLFRYVANGFTLVAFSAEALQIGFAMLAAVNQRYDMICLPVAIED
jgi:hypothetical protein